MIASAAVFAVMLTGQVASAWKCPSRDFKYVDHIDEESFVDNFNEFDVYGSEDADVVIDKLSRAGDKSTARYVFDAFADGKTAVVWDSNEQKVVNCKTVTKRVIRYRNCRYYFDNEATKACREASAIAEIDVWGDDAKIDVSKFTLTTDGFSTTTTDTTATGSNLNSETNQSNTLTNEKGKKTTASANVSNKVRGDKSSIDSSVKTTVEDRKGGKRVNVSGGDRTSTSSKSRSRGRYGRRGL